MTNNNFIACQRLAQIVFCIQLCFGCGLLPTTGQEPQAKVLRNQDVVSLSKAGLSDGAIVTLIRKSKTDFDLSADGLVSLRNAGVHNEVIEAMLGSSSAPNERSAPATSAPSTAVPSLPKQYGYFLIGREMLVAIEPVPVRTVIGLAPSSGGPGWAVDGVAGRPSFKVTERSPSFLIYQQNVNVQSAMYSSAVLVKSMRAGEFDRARTNPKFFPSIYHHQYNDIIPVNLWRPDPLMNRFVVEPIVERPGMFKLRTQEPLAPGRYIAYFEGTIHNSGTVFATAGTQASNVLFFEVTGDPNCTDYNGCLNAGLEAMRSAQWDESLAYLEKANVLEPSKAEPWAEMGRVYLALGQFEESRSMWDKALQLGGTLRFEVLHLKGLSGEKGVFRLSVGNVSFLGPTQEPVFSVAPGEVFAHRQGGGGPFSPASFFGLRAAGKNYNFIPLPVGFVCKNSTRCEPPGFVEQVAVSKYIDDTITRLPSGAFSKK